MGDEAWFQRTEEARVESAWRGLFAGADWAAQRGESSRLSRAHRMAMLVVEAADRRGVFPVDEAVEARESGQWMSHWENEIEASLDALVVAIAICLWARSRSPWRIAIPLDELLRTLGMDSPERVVIHTLCQWLRWMERDRPINDWWDTQAEGGRKFFLHNDFSESLASLVTRCNPASEAPDDIPVVMMARTIGGAAAACDFDACMQHCLGSGITAPQLLAVAGAFYGMAHGRGSVPVGLASLDAPVDRIEAIAALLVYRFSDLPGLKMNVPITSDKAPLALSPLSCAGGRLLLTTAPGQQVTWFIGGKGRIDLSRDMDTDVRRIAAQGVQLVVNLMQPDEVLQHEMGGLASAVEQAGMELLSLHVPHDGELDEFFHADMAEALPKLRRVLKQGGAVAIFADDWDGRFPGVVTYLVQILDPCLPPEEASAQVQAAIAVGAASDDRDLY